MPQNPVKTTLFVSQIKAGTGITVSPAGGTGVVTLNAAAAQTPNSITGNATPFPITGQGPATATSAGGEVDLTGGAGGATSGAGGPAAVAGGAATNGNSAGGAGSVTGGAGHGNAAGGTATVTGGAGGATGAGGTAVVQGGAGGATSGAGGVTDVFGGNAAGGNANGGDVNIAGGAANGSGVNGVIRETGVRLVGQGAPTAATVSAVLTAAAPLSGIITVLQGAAGASAQQLPLATAMDTALPTSGAGDAFDFSVINISTNAAESASLTTNAGWTLVGDMDVAANSAATTKSAGRFRARKTGAGAWTLYRLS